MDEKKVEILACEAAFKGYFRVDRYRLRHIRFDGSWSPEMEREVFERGVAAAVLLYDPRRDVLALIEQFRVGAMAAGLDPWMLEVVAGIVDEGETPDDVARREAVEEANCRILRLERLFQFMPSPGACTETITLFVGEIDSDGAGGVFGVADEHEDIRVRLVGGDEAARLAASGAVTNGPTLIALQWFALNGAALRQRWLGAPAPMEVSR